MKAGSSTITSVRDRLNNCINEIIHILGEKRINIPEPFFLVGGNQNKVSIHKLAKSMETFTCNAPAKEAARSKGVT